MNERDLKPDWLPEDADLSVRAYHALYDARISSRSQLAKWCDPHDEKTWIRNTPRILLEPNVGPVTLAEFQRLLANWPEFSGEPSWDDVFAAATM